MFISRKLTPELLGQIAGAGFEGVELFCSRAHFDYTSRSEIQAMAQILAGHKLTLCSLHAPTSRDMGAMRESGTPLSVCEVERVRRIVAGATVEEAGFDKRTDAATMQRFHRAAIALVPELRNAKILEDWAGLRPGTPDALPVLGATGTPGYYVATGHFRDGILLGPITAQVMADVITGVAPEYDLAPFSAARFWAGTTHS